MTITEAFNETSQIFNRWIKKTLRRPPFLFFALVQPIVWFVLFTQTFQAIAQSPAFIAAAHTNDYTLFFLTAVLLQTAISSGMQSGMGMVQDMESGFLDKMRVAPIHRSSILAGKVLSDTARIALQAGIILAIGYAFGARVATGLPGILLILGVTAAFGIAWSGISNVIALATRNSESTMMISIITTFPLLFLSTAMMPMALLPSTVQTIATYNPITYVADALHSLSIVGYDWTVMSYALSAILVVGLITLSSATRMFHRTVSG